MQTKGQPLSFDRVNAKLRYDPATGGFFWRTGGEAGCVKQQGYVVIGLDRRYYGAHRLAIFLQTGAWPAGVVDHINGVRSDNRWENLRVGTQAENCRNQAKAKSNTSGYKGVYWHVRIKKWVASIRTSRKLKHLGYFATAEQAADAYDVASAKFHGEFGRPSRALLNTTKEPERA